MNPYPNFHLTYFAFIFNSWVNLNFFSSADHEILGSDIEEKIKLYYNFIRSNAMSSDRKLLKIQYVYVMLQIYFNMRFQLPMVPVYI